MSVEFLSRVYANLAEWLVNIRFTLYSVLIIFSPPGSIEFEYVIDHTLCYKKNLPNHLKSVATVFYNKFICLVLPEKIERYCEVQA